MGPLGQIAGEKSTGAATKKKQKEKAPVSPTISSDSVPGTVSECVGICWRRNEWSYHHERRDRYECSAGSQPGDVGGTIGMMQMSTMAQAGILGQTGTTGDASVVVKQGKLDLASRVVITAGS